MADPRLIASLGTVDDLVTRASDWIASDPDESTRVALQDIVDSGDETRLASHVDGTLSFGTAGIRGEVGPGPARMNRAVVIRTTKGLADYLIDRDGGANIGPVILGFDARPSSRQFAEDTAGVLLAAGFAVYYFPIVTPTPLVAFATKHFDAVASVVVTASHNPPADNGYKVYDANGAQIISPVDTAIASAIELAPGASSVPKVSSAFDGSHQGIRKLGDEVFEAYWVEVDAVRPAATSSDLTVVYTPMHGVGTATVEEVFRRGGHSRLLTVPSQAKPDGLFPTVSFPNPEEPGALDLAEDLAREVGADLILANDPDADRLAVEVPFEGGWRALSGNEIGVLLGDYMLRNTTDDVTPIVLNSIVSSPMLGQLAAFHGAHHEATLTGFKWIANAGLALESKGVGKFVFGFEEALGYTIGRVVRDKDGISAALVFTDLAAGLRDSGSSIVDRLAELWLRHGLWVSTQRSVVKSGADGAEQIQRAVGALGDDPPGQVGEYEVSKVVDYRVGAAERPPWLGAQSLIELELGDGGRILVRPSGTEPKLKIYVDLRGPLVGDPMSAHRDLLAKAERLAGLVVDALEFD